MNQRWFILIRITILNQSNMVFPNRNYNENSLFCLSLMIFSSCSIFEDEVFENTDNNLMSEEDIIKENLHLLFF